MAPTVNENGQNSQSGSRGWLSERDLLEAINEMGYNVSPDELTALRDDIEQFIEEEDSNEHNDDETNVSFSSLRFPDELRDNGRKKGLNNKEQLNDDNDELLSRFRSLNNAELLHERCAKSSSVTERTNAECDNKEDDSDDDELDRNAISDLIYEGYRCFEKLIADNQRITQLTKQVGLKKETQADGRNEVGEGVGYKRTSEEGEEKYEYEWPSLPVYSTPSDENFCQRSPPPAVDPSIRPVLRRLPGCVPFKHDPVKKFELYQREWRRNPPPGEKKRISLRWKVREYMLRQDVPRLTAQQLARKRQPNPEWTPKAYL